MKKFVETVVGGTIGLIALYVVAKVAYNAGQEMARTECHYQEVQRKTKALESRKEVEAPAIDEAEEEVSVQTVHVAGKAGIGMGFRRLLGKKTSVIGRFVKNPEGHMIEASVEGDEIHLNVKQKPA